MVFQVIQQLPICFYYNWAFSQWSFHYFHQQITLKWLLTVTDHALLMQNIEIMLKKMLYCSFHFLFFFFFAFLQVQRPITQKLH